MSRRSRSDTRLGQTNIAPARPQRRFAIALTFSTEKRTFVEQVADRLGERLGRHRILYDLWYAGEFARPNLDTYLQSLYIAHSELTAVFISAEYQHKDWCGLEWRCIRDLFKRRETDRIMLLRFDMTEIPGLLSIDGYAWIGDGRSPEDVAGLILQRWQSEYGHKERPTAVDADPNIPGTADAAPRFQLGKQVEECHEMILAPDGQISQESEHNIGRNREEISTAQFSAHQKKQVLNSAWKILLAVSIIICAFVFVQVPRHDSPHDRSRQDLDQPQSQAVQKNAKDTDRSTANIKETRIVTREIQNIAINVSSQLQPLPKQPTTACPWCPRLILISTGSSRMGSPETEDGRGSDELKAEEKTISRPYCIGRYEITFDDYKLYAEDVRIKLPDDEGMGRGRNPLVNVSWDDAESYTKWLSKKTGRVYRLPTELEWEYAARAKSSAPHPWTVFGDACISSNVLDENSPHDRSPQSADHPHSTNAKCKNSPMTMPVDSYEPNGYGLYNVLGNVWEWTADCESQDETTLQQSSSSDMVDKCERKIIRGGGWRSNIGTPHRDELRFAERKDERKDVRRNDLGFRVAAEPYQRSRNPLCE